MHYVAIYHLYELAELLRIKPWWEEMRTAQKNPFKSDLSAKGNK